MTAGCPGLGMTWRRGITPAFYTPFAWYRSDDDAAHRTLVSGNVSVWKDQSGNGYDLLQGTAANRPAFTTGAINGLPALTFDGTNDYLMCALPSLDLRNCTIACVSTQTASTGDHATVDISMSDISTNGGTGTTNDGHQLLQEGGHRKARASENGAIPEATYAYSATTTAEVHFYVKHYDAVGASRSVKIYEGATLKTTTAAVQAQTDVFLALRVGSLFQDVFWHNGLVAEVVCFATELDATAITRLTDQYFTPRYGL